MRSWLLVGRVLAAGFLAAACSSGEASPRGAGEPFRVRGSDPDVNGETRLAQFISGPLPGFVPDGGTQSDKDPHITELHLLSRVVFAGSSDVGGLDTISGLATDNTWAVGVRLADVGSGYWVVPTETIDPATGNLTWSAPSDFGFDIPAGYHELELVGLDRDGFAGARRTEKLCVTPRVTDNYNACEPGLEPPAAVISLTWDANVDLDLQVETPDGLLVDSRQPCTLPLDSDHKCPLEAGQLDRDSNQNCTIDGVRYENVVWQTTQPLGKYKVYANLYNACGLAAVRFNAGVYMAESDGKGGKTLHQWYQQSGELLDIQANAGSAVGLFLFEFKFK